MNNEYQSGQVRMKQQAYGVYCINNSNNRNFITSLPNDQYSRIVYDSDSSEFVAFWLHVSEVCIVVIRISRYTVFLYEQF